MWFKAQPCPCLAGALPWWLWCPGHMGQPGSACSPFASALPFCLPGCQLAPGNPPLPAALAVSLALLLVPGTRTQKHCSGRGCLSPSFYRSGNWVPKGCCDLCKVLRTFGGWLKQEPLSVISSSLSDCCLLPAPLSCSPPCCPDLEPSPFAKVSTLVLPTFAHTQSKQWPQSCLLDSTPALSIHPLPWSHRTFPKTKSGLALCYWKPWIAPAHLEDGSLARCLVLPGPVPTSLSRVIPNGSLVHTWPASHRAYLTQSCCEE